MSDLYYLPKTGDDLENIELAQTRMPGFTYKVNLDNNRVKGMTDFADALSQALYHILQIERYEYPIYPQSYGSELANLIGRSKDYAVSELKRTISEALLQDDRVTGVDDWDFSFGMKTVTVSFTVSSIYGQFEFQGELTR